MNLFTITNKKLLLLFLLSTFFGVSQNYEMDLINGQTINTCVGVFHDSETNLNSNFDGNYEYGINENYTVTFCSNNLTNINIYFENLGLAIGENDIMYIYDGANTSSPQVAGSPFTNGNFNDLFIIGTGTCVTINFVSDGVTNQPSSNQLLGWNAYIGCGNTPSLPTIHDCLGAVPLCQTVSHFNSALNATGIFSNEISTTPLGCVALESGGVWYTFTPLTTGVLNFSIIPDSPQDYDWNLFDLTNVHCDSLFLGDPLNYLLSASTAGGPPNQGATGISSANSMANSNCVGPGNGNGSGVGPLDWNGFNNDITVTAGNTYFIYVAQFSGVTGYTIDFSGSTASLFDSTSPLLNPIINASCNVIDISFSENILCSSIQNNDFILTGPGGPYTISSINSVACNQGQEGDNSYTLTVSPSLLNGSYTLELNAFINGSVEDVCGNLAITTSEIFSVNACGCAMTAITNSSNPTCFNSNDGDFSINVFGSSGSVNYLITDELIGGNQLNVTFTSSTANNLAEGWYYFSVTDDLCTIIDSIFINAPDDLIVNYTVINPDCYGIPNGIAFIDTVENHIGAYNQITFQWSQGALGADLVTNDSLYNIGENDYFITVTDSIGCQDVISFTVTYPDSMYFNELGFDSTICRNQIPFDNGHGQVYVAAIGGSNGNGQGTNFSYLWTELSTGLTTTNSTWGNRNPGYYKITATNDLGCVITQTIYVDSLSPEAIFTLDSDQLIDFEGTAIVTIQLTNQSINYAFSEDSNADTTFIWTFGNNLSEYISSDIYEVINQQYLSEGEYEICLVVIENLNGCQDTACQTIIVHDIPNLEVPNVFTPGEDGVNNEFYFPNKAIIVFNCFVYDRWGKEMFEFTSINDKWNGVNMNNGKECTDGVYFYIYEGESSNGTKYKGQGNVHLIRE